MYKSLLIIVFLFLSVFAAPICADLLLAGYESSETNLTVSRNAGKDFGLTITWPLLGGVSGAPNATQGSYVLRLDYTGETDRKIEINHAWSAFTFDLVGYDRMMIDVYIDTPSAIPGIVGMWDFVFDWLGGSPTPIVTDEWVTVSMDISGHNDTGLSSLFAFVFDQLAGDNGTIFIDNLRLADSRHINFSGYTWSVKFGFNGPGPNYFSDSNDSVSVDSNDHLHMNIRNEGGYWFCSEIINDQSLGYGTYVYTLKSRVDLIDLNAILGLFTWDTYAPANNYTEIDFEFGRWGNPLNDNAQYVIQPWDGPGNLHRFDIDYSGPTNTTTHIMTWRANGIYFKSYYGDFALEPPPGNIIDSWLYTGGDNPPPTNENARINYWLVSGLDPAVAMDAEFIITDFQHLTDISDQPGDIDNDLDVDFEDFSDLSWEWQSIDCDEFNNWCNRTDLTGDGTVNFMDLQRLCFYWAN